MQVKDVMMSLVGHVDADTSLRDAAATMRSLQLDPIPVLEKGKVVGLLSERDILAVVARDGVGGGMRPAREIMTTDVPYCRPDQSVVEAAEAAEAGPQVDGMERLLVVDDHLRLLGLVSRSVLRHHTVDSDDEDQAIDAFRSLDDAADYQDDPVRYMSDESFPASDPIPPPSKLGPDADE